MPQATEKNLERMRRFVDKYAEKSGTSLHPDPEVTAAVVTGLALHQDQLGRPLCPCRFYVDKVAEIEARTWICACDDMKRYKYCHCLLFVGAEGLPITEYLPEGHEGREAYGVTPDPDPTRGREAAGR